MSDDLRWPRERSEEVGDFRHFRVRRDWNRSPESGEVLDFYVLEMPDWVQVVPLTPEGRFVMVEQFRPGTRQVTIEFPAGLVEPGESPADCAVRELEEETGYRGEPSEEIGVFDPNPALQNNRLHIILVRDCRLTGQVQQDPRECVRAREVDPGDVNQLMEDGLFRDAYGIVAWDSYRRYLER